MTLILAYNEARRCKSDLVIIDSDLNDVQSDVVIIQSDIKSAQSQIKDIRTDTEGIKRFKKGVSATIEFPIYDTDMALVSSAGALDSEVSKDHAGFADCDNEATEIGSTGIYYLVLTGTEMTADVVTVQTKSTEGVTVVTTIYTVA